MEVLLRGHGGDGGATAVLVRSHGGHGGAAATPLRICPTLGGTAEVLNIFKVSAVPPRTSAVLTVVGGATAINDGTTAEPRQPRRSWPCHCGLCRTSFRCDGGSTAEAAVPPRTSAVLTVSAVLRRSMTEPLRNHGDRGGATAVYAVQAPQWHRASGVTGVLHRVFSIKFNLFN